MGKRRVGQADGIQAWTSGLVATATVAALQQISRELLRNGPRLDVMGERHVEKAFATIGREPHVSGRDPSA